MVRSKFKQILQQIQKMRKTKIKLKRWLVFAWDYYFRKQKCLYVIKRNIIRFERFPSLAKSLALENTEYLLFGIHFRL